MAVGGDPENAPGRRIGDVDGATGVDSNAVWLHEVTLAATQRAVHGQWLALRPELAHPPMVAIYHIQIAALVYGETTRRDEIFRPGPIACDHAPRIICGQPVLGRLRVHRLRRWAENREYDCQAQQRPQRMPPHPMPPYTPYTPARGPSYPLSLRPDSQSSNCGSSSKRGTMLIP